MADNMQIQDTDGETLDVDGDDLSLDDSDADLDDELLDGKDDFPMIWKIWKNKFSFS